MENVKRAIENIDELSLIEKISHLKIMEEEKNQLFSELSSINTRLKDNHEAKKELQNSTCPYLKETCKNLQDKNSDDFFISKEKKLDSEKQIIETKLNSLNSELIALNNLEFELKNYTKQKNEYEISLMNLEKDIFTLSLIEKDLEISTFKFENYIRKIGNREQLTITLTQFKTKLGALEIDETKKTLNVKESQVGEILSNIKNFESKNSIYLKELSSLENNFNELIKLIKTLEFYPLKHSEESDKLKEISLQKKSLQSSYEIYLGNEPIAKKLPLLQILYEETSNNKIILEKELSTNTLFLLKLEEEIHSREPLENLKSKELSFKSEIEELNKNIGAIENNINSIKTRIEKSNNINNSIKEKEKIILKLKKKIELTENFRKNIKDMGTKVSQTILEEISFWATDNFRKISGRSESVLWSNLDSPYEISLVGDKKITFEQLSGGEQVAVAISLRGAMSSIFTKANFSIFDEPTNNLDTEKRKSLADNIGEILKKLDQSIVVTHDDSFREMAQKVIEL